MKPEQVDKWTNFLQMSSWIGFLGISPWRGRLFAVALGLLESQCAGVAGFMLAGKLLRYLVVLGLFEGHSFLFLTQSHTPIPLCVTELGGS